MARKDLPTFEDWEAEKLKDAEFVSAAEELEPGYQGLMLRLSRATP